MHRLIERLWQQHGFTAALVTRGDAACAALEERILNRVLQRPQAHDAIEGRDTSDAGAPA